MGRAGGPWADGEGSSLTRSSPRPRAPRDSGRSPGNRRLARSPAKPPPVIPDCPLPPPWPHTHSPLPRIKAYTFTGAGETQRAGAALPEGGGPPQQELDQLG